MFITGIIVRAAPKAIVENVRVLDGMGLAKEATVVSALARFIGRPEVSVINMSLGTFGDPAFPPIALAQTLALLPPTTAVVAAAGNNHTNQPMYPGRVQARDRRRRGRRPQRHAGEVLELRPLGRLLRTGAGPPGCVRRLERARRRRHRPEQPDVRRLGELERHVVRRAEGHRRGRGGREPDAVGAGSSRCVDPRPESADPHRLRPLPGSLRKVRRGGRTPAAPGTVQFVV